MKIRKLLSVGAALIAASCLSCMAMKANEKVSVADYGLKPNTRQNAIPYVNKLLEANKDKKDFTIVFPRGRYDFYPQYSFTEDYYESNTTDVFPKYLAVLLKNIEGVTLDGDSSELIMHGRIQPITVDNSKRVKIQNLSIDWEIPLTAQGEVVASTDEYMDVRIADESPYVIENGELFFVGPGFKAPMNQGVIEFRGDTRYTEPYVADQPFARAIKTEVSKGIVRFTVTQGEKWRFPPKGNLLVLRHSERDHAGIFVCDSKDIAFENVNVYHTAGLGILSQYTENIKFNNCTVGQNKAKNRILSGHDDGLHFSGCKGDIYVDNCHFEGLMDDPINVHGTCARIIEVVSPTKIICQFMHSMSVGMVWGQTDDVVGFIENKSMATVGKGKLKSFKALDTERFEIEVSEPIPDQIKAGAALENLTWSPSVVIKNTYFGPCRARGLLLSTPGKIVVENCTFASSGSAILIAGDANYWYESGACTDVLIKGNKFLYPCMSAIYQFCQAIISIEPEIPSADPKKCFHRNIRIEDNQFNPFDAPILYAKSVENISFTGNQITRSYEYKPFHPRKEALIFEYCQKVKVSGNKVIGDLVSNKIQLNNMSAKELSLDKSEYFKLQK